FHHLSLSRLDGHFFARRSADSWRPVVRTFVPIISWRPSTKTQRKHTVFLNLRSVSRLILCGGHVSFDALFVFLTVDLVWMGWGDKEEDSGGAGRLRKVACERIMFMKGTQVSKCVLIMI